MVRLVLAALIALVGYAVARGAGASHARSIVYGVSILAVATAVAGQERPRRPLTGD